MPFELPELPYAKDALEPLMSSKTLEYHHGRHHAGYIKKLNKLIEGTAFAKMTLPDIIVRADELKDSSVFNNAAQAFNHELFWNSLTPSGKQKPEGSLASAIRRDFGSVDEFEEEFRASATGLFASGWVWLVSDDGRLRIIATGNAGTPLVNGLEPLLTLDVWEHAYYLDVQNDRGKYVDTFLNELVDWSAAGERFERLRKAA